jgi:cobalt-zinc-cadmium efflux system outer membrane protein
MLFRCAAIFAAVSFCCAPAGAQEAPVLTLEAAFARVLEKHPDLARFTHLREGAAAALETDGLRPPLRLDLELENAPRSGQDSAFDSAEATLSLASVFERGNKREARVAVADARLSTLTLQQEQHRADLLAEVARRYLDLLSLQSMEELAAVDLAQREKAFEAAAQRVRAGATPESVRLAAEAAVVRATLQRDRLRAQSSAATRRLAVLWKDREPGFNRVAGNPLSIPSIPSLEKLRDLIERSPELRRFADESRLREARVQLARSQRATDIDWRAGVRRLEEDGSWAAVVGVSVPLGSASRAEPGIRAVQAELAALSLERESEAMTLEATLIDAWSAFIGASAEVAAARDVLLPKFEQAAHSSERAFRGGALTYTEWSQVQADAMSARREQLLAALEAHRALIEIQRLTGSSFVEADKVERTQP